MHIQLFSIYFIKHQRWLSAWTIFILYDFFVCVFLQIKSVKGDFRKSLVCSSLWQCVVRSAVVCGGLGYLVPPIIPTDIVLT